MQQAHKRTANELLGYPADARLLILNADDFGMCHATNVAIIRAFSEGVVSSTTLMVPCPWAPEAMQWLAENPAVPFGVHLTAIGDSAKYRWRPLTCREKVPTLIDETGCFYNFDRMDEFFAQVRLDELATEFRAQIDAVLAAGLRPTHLDWHSLRIARKPEVFDVIFELAREYGLALRASQPLLLERTQRQDLPVNDGDFLDSYALGSAGKLDLYSRLLHELPAGLSEWAVHPGVADAELRAIDFYGAPIHQADLDCMVSAAIREVIEQEGIILLSYKPLQEVWRARANLI
jgi:predicted glycoside hydrolase/deacetylase ChbG (UPF0249 family)